MTDVNIELAARRQRMEEATLRPYQREIRRGELSLIVAGARTGKSVVLREYLKNKKLKDSNSK